MRFALAIAGTLVPVDLRGAARAAVVLGATRRRAAGLPRAMVLALFELAPLARALEVRDLIVLDAFFGAAFLTIFLAAARLGAALRAIVFFGAAFFTVFLAAALLGAALRAIVFFGAAFFAVAARLGAARFGAADFFTAAFLVAPVFIADFLVVGIERPFSHSWVYNTKT